MILIKPIITEKARNEQTRNTYMFVVPSNISKQQVAQEVAVQYKVTPISVRIMNRKGKPTKFRRGRHAYPGTTYKQNKKFAFVTLKSGDHIKIFDEEEVKDTKVDETKTTVKTTEEKKDEQVKKTGLFARRRTGRRGDK